MGGAAARGHQSPFSFILTLFGAGAAQVGRCLHPGWQLARATLPLPSQLRLMGAIWNQPGSASHSPSVLPGSPEGFPGSDRSSHRHRDLLAALSWFSRLHFHLLLSREPP